MVKPGSRGVAAWIRQNALGLVAIFIALGGSAVAANVASKNSPNPAPRAHAATKARRGPRGPQGPQGPAGPKGDQGIPGPATGAAGGDLTGNYPNPTLAPPEAWHEVGAAGEPGFQNNWVNLDSSTNSTAAFYRDPLGVVHLKGTVKTTATTPTGAEVFILPSGDRPPKTENFAAVSYGGTSPSTVLANVLIGDTGSVQITVSSGLTNSGVTLDGITFRTS